VQLQQVLMTKREQTLMHQLRVKRKAHRLVRGLCGVRERERERENRAAGGLVFNFWTKIRVNFKNKRDYNYTYTSLADHLPSLSLVEFCRRVLIKSISSIHSASVIKMQKLSAQPLEDVTLLRTVPVLPLSLEDVTLLRTLPILPLALEDVTLLQTLKASIKNKTLVCFLDYDGTLSPIVADPEKAFISEATRNLLFELPKIGVQTVIITGRSLERIQFFCEPALIPSAPFSSTIPLVSPLFYCTSHGFEIVGPNINHQPFPECRKLLLTAKEAMTNALQSIEGVKIEDNKFSISIHYRNVAVEKHAATIEIAKNAALDSIKKHLPSSQVQNVESNNKDTPPQKWSKKPVEEANQDTELEMRAGKLVSECRPKPPTSWHKGKALNWLIENCFQPQENLCVLVIGDDLTDEDSFSEALSLASRKRIAEAIPIIVCDDEAISRPTSAKWFLRNPHDVFTLLSLLTKV
jgi:trehalose 6-phosphate phosphatase